MKKKNADAMKPLVNYFPASEFIKSSEADKPCITINVNRVTFSKKMVDSLKLTDGQHILFSQDEQDGSVWYFCLHETGFMLRSTYKKKSKNPKAANRISCLIFHVKAFAEMVLGAWDSKEEGPCVGLVFLCDVLNPIRFPNDGKHVDKPHYKLTMKAVNYGELIQDKDSVAAG